MEKYPRKRRVGEDADEQRSVDRLRRIGEGVVRLARKLFPEPEPGPRTYWHQRGEIRTSLADGAAGYELTGGPKLNMGDLYRDRDEMRNADLDPELKDKK